MYYYYGICHAFLGLMRVFKLAALILVLTALFAALRCLPIHALERVPRYDPQGQLRVLDELLAMKPEHYRLTLIDSFERMRPYRARAASNSHSDIYFVHRIPPGRAFRTERNLIHGWTTGDTTFEQSLLIHTTVEIPGEQNFHIIPQENVMISGQPFRASLWVHSNMYRHKLILLFENADGQEVRVTAGRLDWNGWRRLDIRLPEELYRRGRGPGRLFGGKFTGFLIETSPHSEAGDMAVMLDNFLVVTDILALQYPGSEIMDTWK